MRSFEWVYPGVHFIVGINHFLQSLGPFSILGMFFLFALCGFLGHVFFLAACRPLLTLPRDNLWLLLFFLPGIHIWTCAIGKDSLIFLPLCYVLYAVSRSSVSDRSFVRGGRVGVHDTSARHVFFDGGRFARQPFVTRRGKHHLRTGKVVATAIVLVLTLPIVQSFVGLQDLTIESATARIEDAATNNQTGEGAVELDRLSPPARLATYLFRPLFYDVRISLGLAASFENAVLLALFVLFIYQGIIPVDLSRPTFSVVFAVFFVMFMWFINGMTTANLGLALRQKTQFLPYIFLCLSGISVVA